MGNKAGHFNRQKKSINVLQDRALEQPIRGKQRKE